MAYRLCASCLYWVLYGKLKCNDFVGGLMYWKKALCI